MHRYLVERTFQQDFGLPGHNCSEQIRRLFLENNTLFGVLWIHSFVSPDKKKSYCLYDAPSPEALRRTSHHNHLPVDRILEVRILSPYFLTENDSCPAEQ